MIGHHMTLSTQTLANWGNYPVTSAEVARPESAAEAREYLLSHDRLIARRTSPLVVDLEGDPEAELTALRRNSVDHGAFELGRNEDRVDRKSVV